MNESVHETMKVQHPPGPRTLKDKGREAPRISFIGRVAGTPTALPPPGKLGRPGGSQLNADAPDWLTVRRR